MKEPKSVAKITIPDAEMEKYAEEVQIKQIL